jgi:hypothetical protein
MKKETKPTAAELAEAEEERAAIMEYDGGLPRDEAERKAKEKTK